jgi:hypothetical protein
MLTRALRLMLAIVLTALVMGSIAQAQSPSHSTQVQIRSTP